MWLAMTGGTKKPKFWEVNSFGENEEESHSPSPFLIWLFWMVELGK